MCVNEKESIQTVEDKRKSKSVDVLRKNMIFLSFLFALLMVPCFSGSHSDLPYVCVCRDCMCMRMSFFPRCRKKKKTIFQMNFTAAKFSFKSSFDHFDSRQSSLDLKNFISLEDFKISKWTEKFSVNSFSFVKRLRFCFFLFFFSNIFIDS